MQAPGPGLFRFLYGVQTRGFLAFAGELWQEYGDVFQVRVGSRTLMFAMHPDAVKYVNVTRGVRPPWRTCGSSRTRCRSSRRS